MQNPRVVHSQRPLPRTPGLSTSLKVLFGCMASCGVIVVLLILIAVLAYQNGEKAVPQADRVARQFLDAVKANRPEDAYALTSDEMKQGTPLPALKDIMSQWRTWAGDAGTPELVDKRWFKSTNGSRITLLYRIQGSKQTVKVTMVLISHGGPYRVLSCYYAPGVH